MTSINDLRHERVKKAEALQKGGTNPYPSSVSRDATLAEVEGDWQKYSKRKKALWLAGRVMALRRQGGLIFLDIDDGTGRLQAMLRKNDMKEGEAFTLFADTVDIGDFVALSGSLALTKRKERTLFVSRWAMLSKSLRPLPDKWHGLKDTEERFRKRYLDILMDEQVKERFKLRSRLVREIRSAFHKKEFQEVETPILQSIAGGATAEPFVTHHNALDIDLYLRVAPELYLKKLLIAGFPKVFEIGRLFRNEGIDATHNPEFTTVEAYEAYADAQSHMAFLESLLGSIAKACLGKQSFMYGDEKITFGKTFKRASFYELLKLGALIGDPASATAEELANKAQQIGIDVKKGTPRYKLLDAIFKKTCRPKIIQPTFVTGYPAEMSPLAKRDEKDPTLIDRYQLVIGGLEVVNGFSELNNPVEQRARFEEQDKYRSGGDEEAQPKDEDFLEALEYGMPPAAGLGLSIDRLAMLFTNTTNIREVILFPTLRPKKEEKEEKEE